MAINKNQNEENKNVDVKNEDVIVTEQEPIWRKAVKYSLMGLAAVASGVVGFFIGRGSSDDDDDDKKTENTEN